MNQSWQETVKNAPQISLNQIPEFSHWPKRLLGLTDWKCPERSPEEAWREYELEKYAPRLEYIKNHPEKTLSELLFSSEQKFPCIIQEEFRLLSEQEYFSVTGQKFSEVIQKYLPASAIVELGSGDGTTLLSIQHHLNNSEKQKYFALEPMPSAREIFRILLKKDEKQNDQTRQNFTIGNCNLLQTPFTEEKIPENAVIYTSFATVFLKHLNPELYVQEIFRLQPKVVISFEPSIYELNSDNFYHLCIKKYMEINNYNTTLVSFLHQNDKIEILQNEQFFLGNNPFLPASCTVWRKK